MSRESRAIEALESKLRAIENRELWPLKPGEIARVTAAVARSGVAVQRGKSVARGDRALERVFEDAVRRVEVDLAAVRRVEEKKRAAEIQARADRRSRSRGWW